MGLFDKLMSTSGKMDLGYVPCGEECSKCHQGHCTKSDGHTNVGPTLGGHLSARGFNKALDETGCGHQW